MKKPIILAFLIACAGASLAQDGAKERRTPVQQAQARTERMTKELGLTAEQTSSVDAINRKYAQQAETMREAHEAEMKAALSPEQFAAWQKKRAEAKAKHMERREAMRAHRLEPASVDPKK